MPQIFFGNDVEGFLSREGKWVSPYSDTIKKVEGIKPDGANFELIGAVRNNLKDMILAGQETVERLVATSGGLVSFLPVNECSKDVFLYEHKFGCRPDINFIAEKGEEIGPTREELEILAEEVTERPCGGHIHISGDKIFHKSDYEWLWATEIFRAFQDETDEKKRNVLKAKLESSDVWKSFARKSIVLEALMLLFSSYASVQYGKEFKLDTKMVFDLEKQRRTLYGQPGSVRIKAFSSGKYLLQGVELRSPSSPWITVDVGDKSIASLESEIVKVLTYGVTEEEVKFSKRVLETTTKNPIELIGMKIPSNVPSFIRLVASCGSIKICNPNELSVEIGNKDYGFPLVKGQDYTKELAYWGGGFSAGDYSRMWR